MTYDTTYKYDKVFDQPRSGLCQQEFVSYEKVNGILTKTVVIRKYYSDNDYQDSVTITPMCY